MEEPISRTNSNKERRRKQFQVTSGGGGGGGIGGALLLGGAFAVVAFLITFVNKGDKKKPDFFPILKKKFVAPNCKSEKEDEEEEGIEDRNDGLRSLLQNPSPSADSYLCVANRKIDSSESVAIETSISEEMLKSSVTFVDQEIVFDNSKTESFHNNGDVDLVPMVEIQPEMEMCLLNQENIKEGDLVKYSQFLQTITITGEKVVELSEIANMVKMFREEDNENEDECIEEDEDDDDDVEDSLFLEAIAVTGESVELSKIANMNIQEEEEEEDESLEDDEDDDEDIEEDEDDDDEEEEEEEDDDEEDEEVEVEMDGSEGTGDSSRESTAEAIWPVELIEDEQILELKNLLNVGNGIHQEKINKTETETVLEEDDDEVVSDQGNMKMEKMNQLKNKETGGFIMKGLGQIAPFTVTSESVAAGLVIFPSLAVGLLVLMILQYLILVES